MAKCNEGIMEYINSEIKGKAYQNHSVFEKIDHMKAYYDGLSDTCFHFIPNGTLGAANYASYVYMSICTTLDSIKMLLKTGHITDAFVLIRKLFDTVLVEIYFDVVRKDRFDWIENFVVKDVDEWLKGKHRIPKTDKILTAFKNSPSTKKLFPFFGWDTYLKKNRELLDDSVHVNRYSSILLNCPSVYIEDRMQQLKNADIILNQIVLIHMAFIFYLNGHYMMASDHIDYLDMGMTPPEGSEYWLANYAQDAFDEFIKPHERLATFIKEHSTMEIL